MASSTDGEREMYRDRPVLPVAIVGHAASGKSTLLEALSLALSGQPGGVWVAGPRVDREARGPRVVEGLVVSARRRYTLVDVPGDRSLLRWASRAVSQCRAAILVVHAERSVEAQTREHLMHLRGVPESRLVVFVNACDAAAEPGWLDAVEAEVRESLWMCGYNGDEVAIVRGSALKGRHDARWQPTVGALAEVLERMPDVSWDGDAPALAQIVETYRREGASTVVEVFVQQGRLRVGERYFVPGLGAVRVREIQHARRPIMMAEAGEYVGLRLVTESTGARGLRRGEVLSALEATEARDVITLRLRFFGLFHPVFRRPVPAGSHAFVHLGAAGCQGILVPPSELGELQCDREYERVRVVLSRPLWAVTGLAVTLRTGRCPPAERVGALPAWAGTVGVGRVMP